MCMCVDFSLPPPRPIDHPPHMGCDILSHVTTCQVFRVSAGILRMRFLHIRYVEIALAIAVD